MKVVQVGQTKYYIQTKDDLINLAQQLTRQGYNISQIADLLGVTERTVKRYLSDCW